MAFWDACRRITNRVTNDTFGVDRIQFFPHQKQPFEVRAPFWREHLEVDPDTGAPIRSTTPKVSVLLCDLRGHEITPDDRFQIDGEMWQVERVEKDEALKNAWVYLHKHKSF